MSLNSSEGVPAPYRPTVICLTPIRNEAWILGAFLRCASEWADLIVVADQNSTDASRSIAAKFPKVRLIKNVAREFNEPQRQKMLIEAAREIPGPRILVALDADEFLSGNWTESSDWKKIMTSPPGSVFGLRWLNVFPDFHSASDNTYSLPCVYVDDGKPHRGEAIHSPRVPIAQGQIPVNLNEIRLLHFNFVDPARLASKRRWYMCLERIKFPEKSLIQIYDKYNYADVHARISSVDLPPDWCQYLIARDLTKSHLCGAGIDGFYWYDYEVSEWLAEHNWRTFAYLPIWDLALPNFSAARPLSARLVQNILGGVYKRRFQWWARIMLSLARQAGL